MDLTKDKIHILFKKIAVPASVGTFFQTTKSDLNGTKLTIVIEC